MPKTDLVALAQNIDNEIVELSVAQAHKEIERADLTRKLHADYLTDAQVTALGTRLDRVIASWHELRAQLNALEGVHHVYNWNRAWIVPGGHVHRSVSCHTLYAETQIFPVPQCSALTEDQIVELAADRACTVCYPSAPVEKRSTLLAPGEEAKTQRQIEREAKASEKDAKKVVVTLKDTVSGRERAETFGTVRSARNEALNAYGWALFSAHNHGGRTAAAHLDTFRRICAAVAVHRDGVVAHVDELEAELVAKAGAKFKREIKQPDARTGYKGCSNTEAAELLGKAAAKLDEIAKGL